MSYTLQRVIKHVYIGVASLLLAACGGGGGGDSDAAPAVPTRTFAVTTPQTGSSVGIAGSGAVTFSGTCDDAGTGVDITGSVVASANCQNNQWSVQVDITGIADGAVAFTATERVRTGTAPAPIAIAINKDTHAPVIAFALPAAGGVINRLNATSYGVSGSCSESARAVTVTAGNISGSANCNAGNWNAVLDLSALPNGDVNLVAAQTDVAGNSASATRSVTRASVVVTANQLLPGFPHAIDMYVPSNATAAVIFLHGGGGRKEPFASDLGIKSDASTTTYAASVAGEDWLTRNKVAAVFPQGQTLQGYNAWTWSNYVMDSGQDDVALLQALVSSIKANPAFSSITKIYLVGHSNGGMMANRMWCESPDTFDGFGAIAGPPSVHLDPSLTPSVTNHPCNPSSVKPYIGMIGDSDVVIQTTGNMASALWILNPVTHLNPEPWVDLIPSVLNEKLFYTKRTTLKCAGVVGTPTVAGQVTTYSDCNDSLRLLVVAQTTVGGNPVGGDHCLKNLNGPCITTLGGNTGIDYKSVVVDFLKTF